MNCIIPSKTFIRNRWDCTAWMGRPFGDVISGSSFKSNLLWMQFVQPFTGSVKRWLFPDFDSIIRSTFYSFLFCPQWNLVEIRGRRRINRNDVSSDDAMLTWCLQPLQGILISCEHLKPLSEGNAELNTYCGCLLLVHLIGEQTQRHCR